MEQSLYGWLPSDSLGSNWGETNDGRKNATGKNSNRCWPGYEPVPHKAQHAQGSCRPKSKKAKLTTSERKFRTARERQLKQWQTAHPGSPRKAAQHLHAPKIARRKKAA